MGSQSNGQQSHLQPSLVRQNSWYSLTLNEVENQLGNLGKPLGSMNLDELLKSVWSTEANDSTGIDIENSSTASSSLQRQASLTLARALSGKTVEQVWNEIQQGQKKRYGQEMKSHQREPTLGEMTLEDFLVQAGLFAEASVSPMDLDTVGVMTMQSFPEKMSLSPSSSIGTLTPRRKRDDNAFEKSIERRLRRKIKNRESAARSRARKQAYHNELVSKVSRLEEENLNLKKEKEFEKMLPSDSLQEPKYQLRRMNSASF